MIVHFKEENGGRIIETHDMSHEENFETVKPKTDDVGKLRDMISKLNQQLDLKRVEIDGLRQSNIESNKHLAVIKLRFFF